MRPYVRSWSVASTLISALVLGGCAPASSPADTGHDRSPEVSAPSARKGPPHPRSAPIPQLGKQMEDSVSRLGARQVVVVQGESPESSYATANLYEYDAKQGWHRAAQPWPARNGQRGWTGAHTAGDRSTPVGVFGLTDAGGLLPDPGTKLPYDQDSAYNIDGVGFLGEPLEGAFDHVVAINYNRNPGTPPRDLSRPMGAERGGGIFIHVDHKGPTQACVALARDKMRALLKWLDPAKKPVIAMGDPEAILR
ncbi:hypothetical protein DSC45_12835 [Streptomyces sp. YIM 130001]|uniref:L,D-transpeptidase family protein n=1 Tax=Streptomyces sp. YIM 130001 TaxID=2259644 RepID=UPI000E64832E|nr:L,D-transpeptidase family protein [Streptomyces sp. YIM 130001]RII17781.1 hypothetical protein DSC45_12835 [Streptomyces sp. YIM 130001]